ncbi:zinc-ribbon domain-containing protein [bacterium]|nr:zinc-ribbon domain-containing protein [bacterium]
MIFFGTKGRDESRGLVADGCPNCRQIRAFNVIEQYEVPHLYWVSLGQGKLLNTYIRCLQCDQTFAFEAHKYRELMSCAEAAQSNLAELVRRTHPELLGYLDQPARCQGCGFQRDRPFNFCPQCGLGHA